ncbi:MAG: general secretion pathway protein D [Candidatus Paceibacteria bacterium]|jgi:general secretion pathway protein D
MGYNLRTSASQLFKGLLLALPLLALQSSAGAQETQDDGFQPILKDEDYFVIQFAEEAEKRIDLSEFVKLCQVATNINFMVTDQTQTSLAGKKVTMYGSKRIHKDDFYAFFQIQMFINDFVCVEVGPPHISMILIRSLAPNGGRQNTSIRQTATAVEPAELQDYANQPATLITTVLHLPNLESRTLSQALRGMMVDTATQSLIPAGEHSLILTGFGSYVASIARLLQIINAESAPQAPILPIFDVIPLTHSSAEDVAEIMDQLLEDRRRARQRAQTNSGRAAGADGQRARTAGQGGDDDFTSILVHSRTNSLLVTALPEDMPGIKELVARLDVDVIEPERNFHIYSLENVRAEDIADVLDEFLRDTERANRTPANASAGRTGGGGGGGAAGSQGNEEVVVVPDNNSNSLLISANKQRYEEVVELIRQLDERQPQVLIETALIELNSNEGSTLGIELALADVIGDGAFGATSFGLSDTTIVDGLPNRTPNVATGITAGILDGSSVNLPFLISAANSSGNANVLNIPSVLVNNNGRATVNSTEEQPTTTTTQASTGGNQTSFDGYQSAGISLEISPSISGARYLRLDIALTVSNFTSGFDDGNVPPPRVTREMTTTVNVPDGDTMIIGGVIADVERHSSNSVPFLGDLPLIGHFFRSDTTSNNRTTLYFFVTPHILRDRDFADLWEISYRKKLEAAEVIGPDRVRQVDQYFDPTDESVDFSRFEIPVYKSPERGDIGGEGFAMDALRRNELTRAANAESASKENE